MSNILPCLVTAIEMSHPEQTREISAYRVSHAISQTQQGLKLFGEAADREKFHAISACGLSVFFIATGRSGDVRFVCEASPLEEKTDPKIRETKKPHLDRKITQ